jgi:glycosyltransferase involved in cell wall biosynthesis
VDHLCFRAGAYLSRFADLIIVNSESGVRTHVALGYAPDRMVVISNGIDTSRFRPDPTAGRDLRRQWGIGQDVPVVGIVGRLHPVKDLATFLRASALVHGDVPLARFVCVGDGAAAYKAELQQLAHDLGLEHCVLWTGSDLRVPAVMNALDVLCSSSVGEGFPNVIGEAMACGKPCVVTDVGDSARLLADCGIVVPPRSPEVLGEALLAMLAFGPERRRLMGIHARTRVEDHFSIPRLVGETWSALESLA